MASPLVARDEQGKFLYVFYFQFTKMLRAYCRTVGEINVRCSNVENRLAQLDKKMYSLYTSILDHC